MDTRAKWIVGGVAGAAVVGAGAFALSSRSKATTVAATTPPSLSLVGVGGVQGAPGYDLSAIVTLAAGPNGANAQSVPVTVTLTGGAIVEQTYGTIQVPKMAAGNKVSLKLATAGTISRSFAPDSTVAVKFSLLGTTATGALVVPASSSTTSTTPPPTQTSSSGGTTTTPTTSPSASSSTYATYLQLQAQAATLLSRMNAISAKIQAQEAADGENTATILADPVIASLNAQWKQLAAQYEAVQQQVTALGF